MENIKALKIMDLGRYLVGNHKNVKLGFQLIANPETFNSSMEMPDKISLFLKQEIERIK